MVLMELIQDILPPGVLNIVNGFGPEAGKPLATNERIAKVAFTGETTTGRLIMQYASQNLIPVTLEFGGKSPNIFFESVMDADDEFFDKCLEGAALFALNQGEVCTCPSRIFVQESIADKFIERIVERTKAIKMGHPLDPETMIGAQASKDQYEKIMNYIQIGKDEGAEVLCGGEAQKNEGVEDGFYVQPTLIKGHNKMRVFQEEIFGPVSSVTTFKDGSRSHRNRQRHALRLRRRRLDTRRAPTLSSSTRNQSRTSLGKLLSQLPRARPVRRLQKIRLRTRKSQNDARPL